MKNNFYPSPGLGERSFQKEREAFHRCLLLAEYTENKYGETHRRTKALIRQSARRLMLAVDSQILERVYEEIDTMQHAATVDKIFTKMFNRPSYIGILN